jgi:hypothetical protein
MKIMLKELITAFLDLQKRTAIYIGMLDFSCLSFCLLKVGNIFMRRYDMNRRSQMQGGKKLDFAERDKCKPVLLRLSLAGNLEKPLWDRIKGA